MNNKLIFTTSININASASEVWNALTNPKVIKEYLFGTEAISDWEEGSPLNFRGQWKDQKYEDRGEILTFDEEKKFQYTYWSSFSSLPDSPENYSEITFELEEKNGSTELTLTQKGFSTEEARDHSMKNWDGVLNKMKEILERK